MTPRVSVIAPVYDGSRTLAEAVESIEAQTFSDWELLLCDDGSSDESPRLCDELGRRKPRIRVCHNDRNLGLAATMNRLVSLARGEFIAVQEQDDRSVPERLEWEVAELDRQADAGLVSGIAEWLDDDGRVWDYFPGILKSGEEYPRDRNKLVRFLMVEQCKVVNAAVMIRSSLFRNAGLVFDEAARMSIDWQFFVDAAHRTQIVGIPKVLVRMARGSRRGLTGRKQLQFQEARRCIRVLYRRYRNDPNSPIDYWLYRKAFATELVLEARYLGPARGIGRLGRALYYSPAHPRAWKTVRDFGKRAVKRLTGRRQPGPSGTLKHEEGS